MVRHDSWGILARWLTGLVLTLAAPLAVEGQTASPRGTPVQLTMLQPPAAQPAAQPASEPAQTPTSAPGNVPQKPPILHKITAATERMEMTVTTSRILTLDHKVPQAQVNNPDILELTPLSPNQVQVFAKKPGVTQINLWDDSNRVYTVDVIVFADAQELEMLLRSEFPTAVLRVRPISQGVLISGHVDNPQHVTRIVQLSEEFYPKVINNITVAGVQQIVLHTKVMEVSRTKLRKLGFDWGNLNGNDMIASSVSGLLATIGDSSGASFGTTTLNGQTFTFNVMSGTNAFLGVMEALREQKVMKVLSEPNLVTVSGRPAHFNVGGEIPVLVPQSLGTVSIEWKKWGTQIDFVPIVLGNGEIRLEVRPRVSELDPSTSVRIQDYVIPGLKVREVETGVELKAGQTLALAGLIQDRTDSLNRGIPWVSDLPYVGAAFRRVHEERNEIELLILVTPELIQAVDASEVPPCGPGTSTVSPTDHQLYWKGYLEVPACCGVCGGAGCAACGGAARGTGEPVPAPQPASPDGSASPSAGAPSASSSTRGSERTARVPAMSNYYYNRDNRQNASPASPATRSSGSLPGLLGPVGYDPVQ